MIRIIFGLLLFGSAINDAIAAHHHEVFGVGHNGITTVSFLEFLGASLLIAYGLRQIARGER
jgi:surface polysaccharide O-acyltransferase-like enzyme